MADARCTVQRTFDLLGDFLGTLWNRDTLALPSFRLGGRGGEKRSGNTPLPAEGNRFPIQRDERNPIRNAEGFDFFFDGLLFSLEHGHL